MSESETTADLSHWCPISAWRLVIWSLITAGLAIKSWIVLEHLPSMWLWLDELHYFTTAFDFAHWGEPGVPHPGFLFYPPLTSLFVAPLHLVGLSPTAAYPASLLLLNTLLTLSMVWGGCLIYRELFDEESLFLAAALLFAAPAYSALILMSEALFVSVLTWLVYFFIRAFKSGHAFHFVVTGLLAGALPLIRPTGIVVIPALLLAAPLQIAIARGRHTLPAAVARVALLSAIPLLVSVSWRSMKAEIDAAAQAPTEASSILEGVIQVLASSPDLALVLIRNFSTSFSYISLSTLGVCLPIVLLAAWSRRQDRLVRLVAVQTVLLMVLVAAATALFMFNYRDNPLPRWIMYGRYVDYFAPILFPMALGLYRVQRSAGRRHSMLVVAFVLLLNLALLLVIPERFYEMSMQNQIAPNSLGLTVPLQVVGRYGLELRWVFLALAGALAAAASFPRLFRQKPVRWGATAATLLFIASNYAGAATLVAWQSKGSATHAGIYSRFLGEHPMVAMEGLYLDWRRHGQYRGRNEVMFKVMADHLDHVTAGIHPGHHRGQVPLLTKEEIGHQPILYKHPQIPYRLYSASAASHLPHPSGLALLDAESGTLFVSPEPQRDSWRRAHELPITSSRSWFLGDWDGDGVDTLGYFEDGAVWLGSSLEPSGSYRSLRLGSSGDVVLAGDWDGDGLDSLALFRDGRFYLTTESEPEKIALVVTFGRPGDIPFAGDWDGDGIDTFGVKRGNRIYLRDSQTSGAADREVHLGFEAGQPLVGDWDGDGREDVGVFRNGHFVLYDIHGGSSQPLATLSAPASGGVALAGTIRAP